MLLQKLYFKSICDTEWLREEREPSAHKPDVRHSFIFCSWWLYTCFFTQSLKSTSVSGKMQCLLTALLAGGT